jgi:hypothetical protein
MSLHLMHTPGEWDGTFALVATALLTDLLSDGEPVHAVSVAYEDEDGDVMRATGTVVSLEDGGILFAGDVARISVMDLISVSVA